MTASTDSILFLDKTCPRSFILMQQIKGICPESAFGIRPTSGKKCVDLVLCNEHLLFFPCKSLSCLVWDHFICKLLELSGDIDRIIMMETHKRVVRLIGFCQCFQSFIQIRKPPWILQFFSKIIRDFRINTTKMRQICFIKDNLCHTFCHIPFHISKCLCVFLQCVVPCHIQYRLRGIFSLI